jgi:hypothetical protein
MIRALRDRIAKGLARPQDRKKLEELEERARRGGD